MFCNPCKMRKLYTPSSIDVGEILAKIDKILDQINNESKHKDRTEFWKNTITALKEPKTSNALADLPMKDGKMDKDAWDKKPGDEQRKIWETLITAYEELRYFNSDALLRGKRYFLTFSAMLLLVVTVYLGLHLKALKEYTQTTLTPTDNIDILDKARLIELKLAALKEQKKLLGKPRLSVTSAPEQTPVQEMDIVGYKKEIIANLGDLKEKLHRLNLSLPFETIKLLGAASAELEADDTTIYVTYQTLLKHLTADLDSLSTAYFWTIQPWRWVELSLWATIGCLIGLLFYIAGSLGQGIFRCEDGFMFWAEILMAPIVVPVVFFLFAMTGITDFVPSENSVTVNIGVAFIFGFAIRRTIGFIDLIKKRFFPDPSPGSANPGS